MTTFMGMSTKVIDLIYEVQKSVMSKNKHPSTDHTVQTKLNYKDITYRVNVINYMDINIFCGSHRVLTLITYRNLNNKEYKIKSDWVLENVHELLDLRVLSNLIYCARSNSQVEYLSTELLDLSTEERFYHEINSSTIINDLIDYNSYINTKGYSNIYAIRYYNTCSTYIDDIIYGILTEYKKVLNA